MRLSNLLRVLMHSLRWLIVYCLPRLGVYFLPWLGTYYLPSLSDVFGQPSINNDCFSITRSSRVMTKVESVMTTQKI